MKSRSKLFTHTRRHIDGIERKYRFVHAIVDYHEHDWSISFFKDQDVNSGSLPAEMVPF